MLLSYAYSLLALKPGVSLSRVQRRYRQLCVRHTAAAAAAAAAANNANSSVQTRRGDSSSVYMASVHAAYHQIVEHLSGQNDEQDDGKDQDDQHMAAAHAQRNHWLAQVFRGMMRPFVDHESTSCDCLSGCVDCVPAAAAIAADGARFHHDPWSDYASDHDSHLGFNCYDDNDCYDDDDSDDDEPVVAPAAAAAAASARQNSDTHDQMNRPAAARNGGAISKTRRATSKECRGMYGAEAEDVSVEDLLREVDAQPAPLAKEKRKKNKRKKKKAKKTCDTNSTEILADDEERVGGHSPTNDNDLSQSRALGGETGARSESHADSLADDDNNDDEEDNNNDDDDDGFDLNSAFARATVGAPPPADQDAVTLAAAVASSSTHDCRTAAAAAVHMVEGVAVVDGGGGRAEGAVFALATAHANIQQAQQLALQGNSLAGGGQFAEAVRVFSAAIKLDPTDHRFYGNRGFCYERLRQFDRALKDADRAIELDETWPKGHFRRARALLGQMNYDQAEVSFQRVLSLDPGVHECHRELRNIAVFRLMQLGFTRTLSKAAVKKHCTFSRAFNAVMSSRIDACNDDQVSSDDEEEDDDDDVGCPQFTLPPPLIDVKEDVSNVDGLCSLWVGNVAATVTKNEIETMFSKHGQITSVRLLTDRRCAFVNLRTSKCASDCMLHLQAAPLHGNFLKIKFPDRPVDGCPSLVLGKNSTVTSGTVARGGVRECFYWRTSHCVFGDQCRFQHVPAHRLIDSPNKR